MAIIDAHLHVWDLTRARYDWLGPEYAPINRSVSFDELRPRLIAAGVEASVLVQAADNAEDTDTMLRVADANPEIAGVVAWVPLERPEEAERRLAELRRDPRVVGVRNLIHDRADPDWILRPDVDEGLGVLERAGVTFDWVVGRARHLEHVARIGERHPGLRIVIDHLARPPIGLAEREPWWSLLAQAAENPLVHAKVSGLYSVTADPAAWTEPAVRPFVDRALSVFGADRLLYGGDWPVSILAGGYDRVFGAIRSMLAELSPAEREAILGGTAERVYGIDPAILRRSVEASAAG
jgi:L-fuconolactonase